jgi:hypothetical protein
MEKKSLKKLSLHRETLVQLQLAEVIGGRMRGTADFETCEGCDSYYDRCAVATPVQATPVQAAPVGRLG